MVLGKLSNIFPGSLYSLVEFSGFVPEQNIFCISKRVELGKLSLIINVGHFCMRLLDYSKFEIRLALVQTIQGS